MLSLVKPRSENIIFWSNLEKIKDSLLLNDESFAASLGISYKQYLKYKEHAQFLPLNCVFEFAEKMNFHFADLMTENFKLNTDKIYGGPTLGERYSYATYSETQPILNIVNYLEMVRGTRAKVNLIRKFQLTEDFFNRENQKTNIFLITDIVNYLSMTYQFTENEFMSMGHRTPFVTKSTFLKDKLTHHNTIEDVVSCFFEECTHVFDKNFHYRISDMFSNYAIIEAAPRKHVLEELKIKDNQFGSEEVCLTRMGVISSMTYYKYKKNAPITKISSLHTGDKSNLYMLDLSPFKKLSSPSRASSGRQLRTQSVYH